MRTETNPMTRDTDTNEDSTGEYRKRMPDFPLNRNGESYSNAPEPTTDGGSPSRRGFLAASAAVGLGAAGLASPAGADEHDDHDEDMDHDDDDHDEEMDHGGEDGGVDSLQEVVDNPRAYYVDIHTEAFPQGDVRGQLEAEPGTTEFSVTAVPEQVPDEEGGGNPGTRATFDFTIDPEEEVICFDICSNGVEPPYMSGAFTSTHIHEGEPGEVGPPRVVFPNPNQRDDDPEGIRRSVGCLPVEIAGMTGVEE